MRGRVLITSAAFAQGTEDNVASGGKFPLAAGAGQDSGAAQKAPPGAVNQGPYDMTKWKYGHAADAPSGNPIWNPVKIKMMQGGKVTGGTVFYAHDGQTYCAMANAGYDYIWTEMQHSPHTWQDVSDMWAACPHAKAVPGVRVPNANEFDEQHALDDGALVMVIPTVRSVEEAKEAAKWAFFPPLGGRSNGGGPAFTPAFWGNVPGGYRQTINDNVVLVLMIETLDGLKDADKIATTPGISAIFAARATWAISPATNRAIPTTSARSTSSMMRRSRRMSAFAVPSPGWTVPTSPASRIPRKTAPLRRA